jgi:salicylate hydroxylase
VSPSAPIAVCEKASVSLIRHSVIHRADYHDILWQAAQDTGAELRLNAYVEDIDFEGGKIMLQGGEVIVADVIVGADGENTIQYFNMSLYDYTGLWSTTRDRLLEEASPPSETGDLAYRATVSRAAMEALNDPRISEMCSTKMVRIWFGPNKHAVLYPVKGGEQFNLVLLRPDNLQPGLRTAEGDISEMRASFAGWDESYVFKHRVKLTNAR